VHWRFIPLDFLDGLFGKEAQPALRHQSASI
jgi:hypothetical protein